jgi:hypothetical protein
MSRCDVSAATYKVSDATHRTIAMFATSTASFGALPHHGGAGGVNRTSRRLWRPCLFAPMPPGTDTAGPAARR